MNTAARGKGHTIENRDPNHQLPIIKSNRAPMVVNEKEHVNPADSPASAAGKLYRKNRGFPDWNEREGFDR